jgi:hypothetical protein
MLKSIKLSNDYILRSGFVTNSSSTSYIAFGVVVTANMVIDERVQDVSDPDELNAILLRAFEGFDVGVELEYWEDSDPNLLVYVKGTTRETPDGGFGEVGLLTDIPDASEVGRWLDSLNLGWYREKLGWVFAAGVDQHGTIK